MLKSSLGLERVVVAAPAEGVGHLAAGVTVMCHEGRLEIGCAQVAESADAGAQFQLIGNVGISDFGTKGSAYPMGRSCSRLLRNHGPDVP